MGRNIGIWIDHEQARIVSTLGERVVTTTVRSGVGPHPHYAGAQDGGGEKKYEERHEQHLRAFFADVIARLGDPDEILVLGPGEAKRELTALLRHCPSLASKPMVVKASGRLTTPQLVAEVRNHFGNQPARLR